MKAERRNTNWMGNQEVVYILSGPRHREGGTVEVFYDSAEDLQLHQARAVGLGFVVGRGLVHASPPSRIQGGSVL